MRQYGPIILSNLTLAKWNTSKTFNISNIQPPVVQWPLPGVGIDDQVMVKWYWKKGAWRWQKSRMLKTGWHSGCNPNDKLVYHSKCRGHPNDKLVTLVPKYRTNDTRIPGIHVDGAAKHCQVTEVPLCYHDWIPFII